MKIDYIDDTSSVSLNDSQFLYSNADDDTIVLQIFKGNTSRRHTIIHNFSKYGFFATAIRFHPLKWHGDIALRVEVYGC